MITGFDAFVLQQRRRQLASAPPLQHRSAGASSGLLRVPIEGADADAEKNYNRKTQTGWVKKKKEEEEKLRVVHLVLRPLPLLPVSPEPLAFSI